MKGEKLKRNTALLLAFSLVFTLAGHNEVLADNSKSINAEVELQNVYEASDIDRFYITTDDGNGIQYGNRLTKGMGYVSANIVLVDTDGKVIVDDSKGKIKVRGNSTSGAPKKPYNIKLDKKKDIFGFGKGKSWCLLADCYDPTLMRNNMALDYAEALGLHGTPEHRRVEVWVDDEYQGVYLFTEKIKADKYRIDIDTDNGDFLVEMEARGREDEGDIYFSTRVGRYYHLREPDENVTNEQINEYVSKLDSLETTIRSQSWNDISETIDVESFVSYYLLNEYMKTVDFGGLSVYFYCKDGKFYAGPAWDFDLSSGNAGVEYYGAAMSDPKGVRAANCHYYAYLMQHPVFRHKVIEKYNNVKNVVFENSSSWIDTQISKYGEAYKRNFTKWDAGKWYSVLSYKPFSTFNENVDYFRNWLKSRYSWMCNYIDNLSDAGICREKDGIYYYKDGVRNSAGLVNWQNEYYYAISGGRVVTGEYDVVETNGLLLPNGKGEFPQGEYTFDDLGRMIVPLEYEVVRKVEKVEPSCTKDGMMEYWIIERTGRCYDSKECNNEVSIENLRIDATGHDFEETVVAPTPKEKGHLVHKCRKCGECFIDNETDATGTEVKQIEPTCTQKGVKKHWKDNATGKLYKDCDYTEETTLGDLEIPALNHLFEEKVIKPTKSMKGYTLHICTRCGYSYKDSFTDSPEENKNDGRDKKTEVKKIDISDPFSEVHNTDGGSALTVSSGNARYTFDAEKSSTVIVTKKINISTKFKENEQDPYYDQNAKHRYVVNDNSIARINKKGVLKPKKRGNIIIELQQKNDQGEWKTVGSPVSMFIQKPEMINKEHASVGTNIDAYRFLSCTTYSPTLWKSTNSAVAFVDENGVVTVKKKGKAKIVAVYGDGKISRRILNSFHH